MRLGIATCALVLMGCASSPGVSGDASRLADADACGGPTPTLDTCVRGAAWAECGGSTAGGPRFACDLTCAWFNGACLPAGYAETQCPASDICCASSGLPHATYLSDLVVGWGRAPWDRRRERNVRVVLGATSTESRPFVRCAVPNVMLQGPCTGGPPPQPSVLANYTGALVVRVRDARHAMDYQEVVIEVTRDDDGALGAKVCVIPSTDASGPTCMPELGTPQCATSGTLTMRAFPRSQVEARALAIDVSGTLPDGSPIELRL